MFAGDRSRRGRGRGNALRALLFGFSLALASTPTSAMAEAPYEPNDTTFDAAGPLLAGHVYSASPEAASDRDFFYFYVTAPQETQTTLGFANLSPTGSALRLNAKIFDAAMTPVAGVSYLGPGESGVLAATLPAQKYFVEVTSAEGFGNEYSLAPGGADGAFGPYAAISAHCASAERKSDRARRALGRAEGKLQRATARLRRSRYAFATTRRRARLAHRRARVRAREARRAVTAAQRSREPWCSIAS